MITEFKIFERRKPRKETLKVGDLVTFTYRRDRTVYKIIEIPGEDTYFIDSVEGPPNGDGVTSRMIRQLTPEEKEEFYIRQQSKKYNI